MDGGNFDRADAIVVGIEGEHSNDVHDPGGDTYWGVSRRWHPNISWPPTWDEAKQIRRGEYWQVCNCDRLGWGLALILYDTAIQESSHDAIVRLQLIVGAQGDGFIGNKTRVLIAEQKDPEYVLVEMTARRMLHYVAQPHWPSNALGWSRRAARILLAAKE